MTTSAATFEFVHPSGEDRVDPSTYAYFRTRNRFHLYNLLLSEFEKSQISQATLARRLGKGADQVNRVLGSPGNLTLDTISDYLYAISGSEPTYGVAYPLEKSTINDTYPEWLNQDGLHVSHSSSNTSTKVSIPEIQFGDAAP